MIYFDTDVLINYLIEQDPKKHQLAIDRYYDAARKGVFFCSLLCLQEVSFVLSRLKVDSLDIETMVQGLFAPSTMYYNVTHFTRAIELARNVGFNNINDCLHTAIAEAYWTEIYTFNKADFKQIQRYTDLKITIFD